MCPNSYYLKFVCEGQLYRIECSLWYMSWIPWKLSFRYIHCTGQFTTKMKANAVPRLLSSLLWIDQYNECNGMTSFIEFMLLVSEKKRRQDLFEKEARWAMRVLSANYSSEMQLTFHDVRKLVRSWRLEGRSSSPLFFLLFSCFLPIFFVWSTHLWMWCVCLWLGLSADWYEVNAHRDSSSLIGSHWVSLSFIESLMNSVKLVIPLHS